MPDLRYLVVVQYPSGQKDKAWPVCSSWKDALGLCATIKQRTPQAKFIVLYHAEEHMLDVLYQKLLSGETTAQAVPGDDLARQMIEEGPGGDHDKTYRYESPRAFKELAAWSRLLARVQRGQIGGPTDGAEREVQYAIA